MGTICEIRVWSRSSSEAQCAFAAGFAEIERIEQMFSAYRHDSELAFVNREAGVGPVPVTEEFFDLTRYAVQSWRRSRGAFDITVGPLMAVWGFRGGEPHIPSKADLFEARSLVGCDKLTLQRRGRTIQFQRQEMNLDFGGLAKGHAVQRAAQVARQQGVIAALVNLGGSSLCASQATLRRTNRNPGSATSTCCGEWAIGVTHPGDRTRCALYLTLNPGWSLSTSGTYEKQFEVNGAWLSHLLDPRTGYPLEGLRSLTTIARSGRRSEALSKYLLALSSAERSVSIRHLKRCDWAHLEVCATGHLLSEFGIHPSGRFRPLF